jgi:hypothetical protein
MPSSCRTWANFFGSTRRRSVIIARRAVRPASVKNSRGKRPSLSSRMRPRAINPDPLVVGLNFYASIDQYRLTGPRSAGHATVCIYRDETARHA